MLFDLRVSGRLLAFDCAFHGFSIVSPETMLDYLPCSLLKELISGFLNDVLGSCGRLDTSAIEKKHAVANVGRSHLVSTYMEDLSLILSCSLSPLFITSI